MIIKITAEKTRTRSGTEVEIFYVREQPHVPGRTIQTTALNLEGALWQAHRIPDVTEIVQPTK